MSVTVALDPTADRKPEQRAALARELQWLAAMLPLGTSNENFARVDDDRVAAIVATALLGLPSKASTRRSRAPWRRSACSAVSTARSTISWTRRRRADADARVARAAACAR
jgi:hypothetical protein